MQKTKQSNFRASPEEIEAAWQAARIERRNFSEYIRELLRVDLRQRGLWPPQHPLTQNEGVKVR